MKFPHAWRFCYSNETRRARIYYTLLPLYILTDKLPWTKPALLWRLALRWNRVTLSNPHRACSGSPTGPKLYDVHCTCFKHSNEHAMSSGAPVWERFPPTSTKIWFCKSGAKFRNENSLPLPRPLASQTLQKTMNNRAGFIVTHLVYVGRPKTDVHKFPVLLQHTWWLETHHQKFIVSWMSAAAITIMFWLFQLRPWAINKLGSPKLRC